MRGWSIRLRVSAIVVALTTIALAGTLVVVHVGAQTGSAAGALSVRPPWEGGSAIAYFERQLLSTEGSLTLIILATGMALVSALLLTLDRLVFSRLEALRAEAGRHDSLGSTIPDRQLGKSTHHDELSVYEAALRQRTRDLAWKSSVLDSVSDIVYVHDDEGCIVYANHAASVVLGYPHEQLLTMSIQDIVPGVIAGGIKQNIARIASGELSVFESSDRTASGEYIPVQVHAQPLDVDGETMIVSVVRDLRSSLRTESTIAHLAFTDPLTGASNRRTFEDRVKAAITSAQCTGTVFSVAFIDLDGLKEINDRLGHAAGDIAIKEVAVRLTSLVRDVDTVARLGGDEFGLLLLDADKAAAATIGERIAELSAQKVAVPGGVTAASLSVGVAVWSGEAQVGELLAKADAAMYEAKRAGKGCLRFFRDPVESA